MTVYLSHVLVRYQFSYQIAFRLGFNQGNLACEIGSFIALPAPAGEQLPQQRLALLPEAEARRCATSGRKHAVWIDSQILPQRHAMSTRRQNPVRSTDFPL